ncbi:hypothetical protein [Micromonospora sp. LOL_023]|uniref:hypothetical protein n=1 Tax=Micromonospora sp. LOL_023 TaxID=3345418 RepID=UPI003A8BFBE9
MVERDAVLLKRFRESYHGDRNRFTDVVGYEIAVNGRAIPDMDLDPASSDTIRVLLRRGVSFAWAALCRLRDSDVACGVAAYVTVTPMLFSPEQVTGNVAFSSVGAAFTPYIDPESCSAGIVVLLESHQVGDMLPGYSG